MKPCKALEDSLIAADLGPATSARLVAEFGKTRFGKDVSDAEVKEALALQITDILRPVAIPLTVDKTRKPFVVLSCRRQLAQVRTRRLANSRKITRRRI